MNNNARILANHFITLMEQRLETIGMHRVLKKENIFMSIEQGEACGWLGLDVLTHNQSTILAINPTIGIRHNKVEEMFAKLVPEIDNSFTPSVFFNLGYLTIFKKYKTWGINTEKDSESKAKIIFSKILSLGLPFVKNNSSLDKIYYIIKGKSYPSLSTILTPYKLPICQLLLNKKDEAISTINNELSRIGTRKDNAAQNYKSFAEKMLMLLNN